MSSRLLLRICHGLLGETRTSAQMDCCAFGSLYVLDLSFSHMLMSVVDRCLAYQSLGVRLDVVFVAAADIAKLASNPTRFPARTNIL